MKDNGANKLKKDLKEKSIDKLYFIFGDEAYLRNYYLNQIKESVTDFPEFNLHIFDGKNLSLEDLNSAIENVPVMADKKVIIVNDYDIYKLPEAQKEIITNIISDLPEYICLVFYYDIIEFKPDKRLKIHKIISEYACFAEFSQMDRDDLIPWIKRRIRAHDKYIDDEMCDYLIFLCGSSMVNLITEIEKAVAHSTTDNITKYNIDEVCSKSLDAVIFDLTDEIAKNHFQQAIKIANELRLQKNDSIMMLAVISKQLNRLYSIKLAEGKDNNVVAQILGNNKAFYIRKMRELSRNFTLEQLRNAVILCSQTDEEMKTTGLDKDKIFDLFLLKMAVRNERPL